MHYKEYLIRNAAIRVDVQNENALGIYGEIFWESISVGKYEKTTFDFIENLHQAGVEYFLDVGAATGCMSLYAASQGLKVIAVEPQKLVFSALSINVGLNPTFSDQVTLVYALVSSSTDESAKIQSFTPGAAGPIAFGEITEDFISLEELIQKCPADCKVAIKIDIEGAEFPLLANRQTINWLAHRKPIIYLALHPGFKKPLGRDANFLSLFLWRLQATRDVIKLCSAVAKRAQIQVASTREKVGFVGIMLALARDEKDYLLIF